MSKRTHVSSALAAVVAITAVLAISSIDSMAVDIGPMTWTPRSEWINVKSCTAITGGTNAVGDGVTDDTAALQGIFSWLQGHYNGRNLTVYFPPGTYKITSTLTLSNVGGVSLLGCGSTTIVSWAGANGGAMFLPSATGYMRYIGFVWEGNNLASCAYEHCSPQQYETQIHHENESFRDFTAAPTYSFLSPTGSTVSYPAYTYVDQNRNTQHIPPPTGAIISGYPTTSGGGLTGETQIYNCRFFNCTTGIVQAWEVGNNFCWHVDGCEFDNCGTGINFYNGACNVITSCHFQQSSTADIIGGHTMRIRHCTSAGSAYFYSQSNNVPLSADVIEDCLVDGWTNAGGAVFFETPGPNTIFDCKFTNPPSGAQCPINLSSSTMKPPHLVFSNNSATGLPPGTAIVNSASIQSQIDYVPAGLRVGVLTSAAQTFLQSSYAAESANIIDVTKPPYSANNNYGADATAAIQSAINAAEAANNGTIVYLPIGFYNISSTLNVTGGNFSIKGDGFESQICWTGPGNIPMMSVTTPQNLLVQSIRFATYSAGVAGIEETATGPCSATYDNVSYTSLNTGNPGASAGAPNGLGLLFSNLPAGSTVYLPCDNAPLTVQNCGAAQILCKYLSMGAVTVSGTGPKTGFLGIVFGEGGQGSYAGYNFSVDDNQSLVVGDFYGEQCANDLDLERGAGTEAGRTTIGGLLTSPGNPSTTGSVLSINANNYQGRLFYGSQTFSDTYDYNPVEISQAGANPIDLTLAGDTFSAAGYDGIDGTPTFSLGSGANLISTLNLDSAYYPGSSIAETPNPLTAADDLALARGLDDFRQLEAVNLSMQYGIDSPAVDSSVAEWKLDETAGSSSYDSSGSDLTGTWVNTPAFSTDSPANYGYAGSLSLNGSNQCVAVANPGNLPSGLSPRTICGWAKAANTAGGWRWIASYGSPGTSQAMFIGMNGTTLDGGAYADDLEVPYFWDNNWHFIALTYDGITAKLYADGALVASDTRNWNLVPGNCYIGEQVNNASEYWNGNIADVRIYNRALTGSEVCQLFRTGASGAALIAGVTATSTSGNAEGNPNLTTSNNSLVAGPSGILGAADSLGDSGFNGDDASDFGNFVTPTTGANITYDLGANYALNSLLVWNFSQPGFDNAGANSVTVLSSTDNVNFTPVGTYVFNEVTENPSYGSPRAIPGNNPPHPTGGAGVVPAQEIPVSIPEARYIKLVINSNYGFTGGLVGINEVNFMGSPVYDLSNDFNAAADSASNTWAYGTYSNPTDPTSFDIPSTTYLNTSIVSGLDIWLSPPAGSGDPNDPNVIKNVSSNTITAAAAVWAPGAVTFGPYQGPAVARFTAPAAGVYKISASFQTDQIRGSEIGDGTTAYVYVGNYLKYVQTLSDPGAAQFGTAENYTAKNVILSAGETVDFVVGGGAFTTQVGATITETSP